MAAGEHDADDFTRGRPPAPADRPWQHPSEFAAARRSAKRRADRRVWTVGLVSAVTGALAVSAVWYLSDPGGDVQVVTQRVTAVPVESVAPRVTPAEDWATEVAADARPATAVIASADGFVALAGAVAVHDDGYLLTSARALDGQTEVVVQTHDGHTMTARVLGHDHETDLVVLKADGHLDPAMVAADPAGQGDVVAVVDPTGPAHRRTVTDDAGVSVAVDGDPLIGFVGLDGDRHQFPAGSPVLDATGAVVGIVAASEPDAEVSVVPIAVANTVAESIISDGEARTSWLGVSATANDASAGVEIVSVTDGSPAAIGGLTVGAHIVSIEGHAVDTPASLVAALRHHAPGATVRIEVGRDDETIIVRVELGDADEG